MSKEAAMSMLTGIPTGSPTPPPSPTVQEAPASQPAQSTPFSQLARQEANLVKARQEFKREQELVSKEKQQILGIKTQYDRWLDTKKTDPIAALKELGFSESDVFNYMAAQQPVELTAEQRTVQAAEAAADAKIKAFENAQIKRAADDQRKSDLSLIKGYRNEVAKTIQGNRDKFEWCAYKGAEAQDLIYETVLAVVKQSKGNDVISPAEATAMVEKWYEDEDEAMSISIKKRANRLPQQQQPVPQKPVLTRSRTLSGQSNAITGDHTPALARSRTLHQGTTATVAATRQTRNESRGEKRDRLIQALKNGTKL
jgi:hypothetical protein